VDNILDLKYFKTLLPELAERKLNVSLFYETKSNLKKDQVRMLRDAGVRTIQPGIESFSNRVLKQMKKGVSGLQNIQLLKWCKEIGVHPTWNFLIGFPQECPDDYFEMAGLATRVCHLPRPAGVSVIRLDRFSPNFTQADQLGFTRLRPLPFYEFLYDLPEAARGNLAYYFAYEYKVPQNVARYADPLVRSVHAVEDDVAERGARVGRPRRSAVRVRHETAGRRADFSADRRGSPSLPGVRCHRRRQPARPGRRPVERDGRSRADAAGRREVLVARRSAR
jgi:radical SAM superfamily enzyme YgiQ (UPF0313 family)